MLKMVSNPWHNVFFFFKKMRRVMRFPMSEYTSPNSYSCYYVIIINQRAHVTITNDCTIRSPCAIPALTLWSQQVHDCFV